MTYLSQSQTNCHVMHRLLPFVFASLLLIGMSANAQLTGFHYELDTMLLPTESPNDPLADWAFYGVYSIYADFSNPTDVLSAVYSDVAALGNPPMGIDAPCGCLNPAATSPTVDASNNPAFFQAFPTYEFDSFWTIGVELSSDPGQLPSFIGMGSPSALCEGMTIDNGSLFITGSTGNWPSNAVAGADLKILIARVTTCGDFTLQACTQVFVEGFHDSVSQACPDPLVVLHMGCTDEVACNYNPNASTDNGECQYAQEFLDCNGNCLNDSDGDGVCDELEVAGCTFDSACNYDPNATDEDGTCTYPAALLDCSGNCLNDDDGDGVCNELELAGCTDDSAVNFNGLATDDDGSCIFFIPNCDFLGSEFWQEMNPGLYTEDAPSHVVGELATQDVVVNLPGLISEPASNTMFSVLSWENLALEGLPPGMSWVDAITPLTPSSQLCMTYEGIPLDTGDFVVTITGTMTISFFGNPYDLGEYSSEMVVQITENPNDIPGCTYPAASNFFVFANIDDGSCEFRGCTDGSAANFNPLANVDDGSCDLGNPSMGCPTDFTGDGIVGAADLLVFLSTYGDFCEE